METCKNCGIELGLACWKLYPDKEKEPVATFCTRACGTPWAYKNITGPWTICLEDTEPEPKPVRRPKVRRTGNISRVPLIYSSDDGGYYFQRFVDWKTSQLFDSPEEAYQAKLEGAITWE